MALLKECEICHKDYASQNYSEIKNILFPSGRLPICKNCVENLIKSKQEIWSVVNKLCQLADIPFNIEDWEKIYKDNGEKSFDLYCKIKPEIVISHDCPDFIRSSLFDIPYQEGSITSQLLEQMFDFNKPKAWYFGHHHYSITDNIKKCKFQCLNELKYCII